MKQLVTIIRRELKIKFRQRSFYIFALVTPLLFLLPIIFSIFSTPKSKVSTNNHIVGIICQSYPYDTLEYRGIKFFKMNDIQAQHIKSGCFDFTSYIGIIDMGENSFSDYSFSSPIKLYTDESGIDIASLYLQDIESYINSEYVFQFGKIQGLSTKELNKLTTFIKVSTVITPNKTNMQNQTTAKIIAYVLGMLLYIMFILYNNNIIRSVSEEKHNKLAEVLSMFVKPNHLMLGKIIGLGLASLVQLAIWIIAFGTYFQILTNICGNHKHLLAVDMIPSIIWGLSSLSIDYIIIWLIIFFILGFLLNGTLATIIAIFSFKSNATVAMVFGNLINLLGIYFGMYAATYPDATLTKFALYCPLFNYLVTPILIPYNIPILRIIISVVILSTTIFVMIKISGKLYKQSLSK